MAEEKTPKIDKPVMPDSSSSEPLITRMARLEKKANFLISLVFLQTLLISAWLLTYLLPKLFIYLQVMLVLGLVVAAVYFFRKQIPGWFGTAARSMFSFVDEAEKKV